MQGGLGGVRWRWILTIAALSVAMAGCGASAQKSQRSFVGYSFITTPQGKPYPVDLTTGQAQSPSVMPDYPFGIINMKITPDGRTLYAIIQQGHAVFQQRGAGVVPINLVSGVAGKTINIPGAAAIAIAPDGGTAYVVTGSKDTMAIINLATRRIAKVIPLPSTNPAGHPAYYGIALSPDGQTAYSVDGYGGVFPVNLMTDTVSKQITVPLGTGGPIVITPDGQTAYLITGTGGNVENGPEFSDIAAVNLTTGTTGNPISVPSDASDIGISPDGRTVYVATATGPPNVDSHLVPIDVATSKPGKPRQFNGGSLTLAVASGSG
jgi:DNA-binding beta-propeller fold protein YncE